MLRDVATFLNPNYWWMNASERLVPDEFIRLELNE